MSKLTREDLDRMRSVGHMKGGRTKDKVKEYRRTDGIRVKETTDELGNTVTQHATKDDRQDVIVRPKVVDLELKQGN
jgi:hypothetical protein